MNEFEAFVKWCALNELKIKFENDRLIVEDDDEITIFFYKKLDGKLFRRIYAASS